jgi:hypothetical protein
MAGSDSFITMTFVASRSLGCNEAMKSTSSRSAPPMPSDEMT